MGVYYIITSEWSLRFTIHTLFQILCQVQWFSGQNADADTNASPTRLGWSHRYKYATVVITILLTVTNYPYLKWQLIIYFLRRCFLSSITPKTFTWLWLYRSNTSRYLIRSRNCLTLRGDLSPPPDFWFFLLFVFTFRVPCCDGRYDFRIKTILGSSFPRVVCRREHVLFTLFVFVYA